MNQPDASPGGVLGDDLYQRVADYAALGDHRTGEPVEALTVDWLGEQLSSYGASVRLQEYSFTRYRWSCDVTIDRQPVQSIPLFYSGIGKVRSDRPTVGTIAPGSAAGLEQAVDGLQELQMSAASTPAPIVVAATDGPTGSLVALNRKPTTPEGVPIVCVAGRHSQELGSCDVHVDFRASIELATSTNVVATFGPPTERPLLIVTPLSGWFRCAGERGTGIALALHAARQLSSVGPVTLVATTGHELGHLGSHAFEHELESTPSAVIHLGASLATSDSTDSLASDRLTPHLDARIAAPTERSTSEAVAHLMASGANVSTPAEPNRAQSWIGEARQWAHLGVPMLSIAGWFPWFHTPEDTPERSTTPALLARTASSLTAAAMALVLGEAATQ